MAADRRYFELELAVKEGDVTVDDRFFVHLGEDEPLFKRRLGELLGDRLRILPA
jgi:hypothetical protein